MKTIDPDRCYLFLSDIFHSNYSGDFFTIVKVSISSVSHCGNWVFCDPYFQHVHGNKVSDVVRQLRDAYGTESFKTQRGINSRLFMTLDEAIETRDATIPKVGDLVKYKDNKAINVSSQKNYMISEIYPDNAGLVCCQTGEHIVARKQDMHIIIRTVADD